MKKRVAIVAGGDQSEVVVSLKSAAGLLSFMNKDRYDVRIVTIIGKEWTVESEGEKLPIDKNDFTYTQNGEKKGFDFAYITIHGIPGEDGRLQGYFEMIGMPYSSCGVLASALTYNKFTCNTFLKNFGIPVAKSLRLRSAEDYTVDEVVNELGLPCFVKPNDGGSSFGVTKVKSKELVTPAIEKAFAEGNEVVIESFMQGTEITCGIYKAKGKHTVFPITEVVSENEFFDYDAKYKGQVKEITPASISEETAKVVREQTKKIYDAIDAKGIIRVDYIIVGETVNLLEVNTTPGMTPTSFIPQQVRAAGLEIGDVLGDIIEEYTK